VRRPRVGVGAFAGLCLGVAMCQRRRPQFQQLGEVLSPVRAEAGNAPRFPARARRCPVNLRVREQQRPAPDPAGAKRPPGAGRVLAGGFGPRLAWRQRGDVAGAMAPANKTALEVPRCDLFASSPGGIRKRTAFPPPLHDAHNRTIPPSATQASARPGGREAPAKGRDGRWPGALAPGWPGGNAPRGRGDGPCHGCDAVPPPPARQCLKDRLRNRNEGQRLLRRGQSTRRIKPAARTGPGRCPRL
jgi:hypothetical protein